MTSPTLPSSFPSRILVLGIGNLLWADEGFGVRAVEALAQNWHFPEHVTLLDGGTQGLYLLPYVQEADALLVFDAVDYGDAPGSLREVVGDEVPRFMGAKKMSLHQTGFQEVLSAAALTGKLPEKRVLIGIQPQELEDFGGSLSPIVREKMPQALTIALQWLARWGAEGKRNEQRGNERKNNEQQEGAVQVTSPGDALNLADYEARRPAASVAWRKGDARFLNLVAEVDVEADIEEEKGAV